MKLTYSNIFVASPFLIRLCLTRFGLTSLGLARLSLIGLSLISFVIYTCVDAKANNAANDIDSYQAQLESVDKAHQAFTKSFYDELVKTPSLKAARFNTIEALAQAVNQALVNESESESESNNSVKAVALIIRNQSLLKRYYDSLETISLIKLLLDNNALINATSLIKAIERQGDDNVIGQLNYLLADFYFQRKKWSKVLSYLNDNDTDLPLEQHHHALLMKGVSLQQQSKHGLAIKAYEKIPATAKHYTAAQLNLAIANIRQGWWTDGHQIISQLLASQETVAQEKTLNRLYITLGYSLLNQAYYRNARKTFQLVGLSSRYSNQALLGIALTAAYQDDYLGALNASRFLKEKQQDDLPIDEAFLLMPFFYEKSQQLATASLGYSQAASYYQDKISALTQLIDAPINLASHPIVLSNGISMNINNMHIGFSANYPSYFFTQRHNAEQLKSWQAQLNNPKLSQDLSSVMQEYDVLTVNMAKSIMHNRVAQLSSYLNQSRYGLARLYDNNTVAQ